MSSVISSKARTGRKVVGSTMLFVALAGGVAQAASVGTAGSVATNNGNTLTVQDTRADGDNAYANWNSSGANRVTTSGGNGSTATVTPSVLNNFRACRDQGSLNPDNCTTYVRP